MQIPYVMVMEDDFAFCPGALQVPGRAHRRP
jgi:hypothetical protein